MKTAHTPTQIYAANRPDLSYGAIAKFLTFLLNDMIPQGPHDCPHFFNVYIIIRRFVVPYLFFKCRYMINEYIDPGIGKSSCQQELFKRRNARLL